MKNSRRIISIILLISILIGIIPITDNVAYAAAVDSRARSHPVTGHNKPTANFEIEIYRDGKLIDSFGAFYAKSPMYSSVGSIPAGPRETIFVGDQVKIIDTSEISDFGSRLEKWDFQYREGDSGGFVKNVYTSFSSKTITLDEVGQWGFFLYVKDNDDYKQSGINYENWSDNGNWSVTEDDWITYFACARIPVNAVPVNNDKVTLHYVKDTWDGPEVKTSQVMDKLTQGNKTFDYASVSGYTYAGKYYADWSKQYFTADKASVYIGGDGIMRHIYFIYNQGGAGNPEPPPDPEPEPEGYVSADLRVYAPSSLTWNYKQFDNNLPKTVEIELDASGTDSNLSVDSYEYFIYIDGVEVDSRTRSRSSYISSLDVYPNDVYGGRIDVEGEVIVIDDIGTEDTATDSATINVEIVNEKPKAFFTNTSPSYATLPVTLTNGSSDPENDLAFISWTIENSKGDLIFYSDTELEINYTSQDYTDSYFSTVDFNENGGKLTFTQEGYYNVKIEVWDDGGGYGAKNDIYTKTIYVNSEPQPPIADFDMYEFGFANESVSITDKSTDPNNDITQWIWTKPTKNKDDDTVASVSGTLSGSGGSLTFTKEGTYDVSLKVIDYTGLHDSITKEIKIIPPIAVARITEEGTFKQNRKATLHSRDSLSPRVDPIDTSRNIWKITPLDGQDPNSIKIDTDTSNFTEKNIVFKEIGRYEVYLKVHNKFGDANPTHPNISASEITQIITITEDISPISDFSVGGAKPNFFDNPISTKVSIKQLAYSLDADIIDKYKYVVYRDMDEDGDFSDETVYGTYSVGETDIIVTFQKGISGLFKVDLEVTERFGQPTIEKFVSVNDRRKTVSSKTFSVDWRPDIKFNIPDWAYTDDILDFTTQLKDEKLDKLNVKWSIKRASESNTSEMVVDSIDSRTEYALDNNGGSIRFKNSGYYELIATVTDEIGQSYTFSDYVRIYPLPTSVIKDAMSYRGVAFTTKENRKYQLNGDSSFANDYYGPELHLIDHSKDYWEIIALDGQNANQVIKVANGVGSLESDVASSTKYVKVDNHFKEDLLFKLKGRYKIRYQSTNTHGKKSSFSEQIVTVVEDTAPIINFDLTPVVYRNPNDIKRAELIAYNITASSNDYDTLTNALKQVRYRFDSDNDGDFTDESWSSPLTINFTNNRATVKVTHVGKYQFEFFVKDTFGQTTISQFVTDADIRTSYQYKTIEVDNQAPRVSLDTLITPKINIGFQMVDDNAARLSSFDINSRGLASNLESDGFDVDYNIQTHGIVYEKTRVSNGYSYFNSNRRPFRPEDMSYSSYNWETGIGDFGKILSYSTDSGTNKYHDLSISVQLYQNVLESQNSPTYYPKVYYSSNGTTWKPLTVLFSGGYTTWSSVGSGEYQAKAFNFKTSQVTDDVRYIKVANQNNSAGTQDIVYVNATAYGYRDNPVVPSFDNSKFINNINLVSTRESLKKYMVMVSDETDKITDPMAIIAKYNTENISVIFVGTSTLAAKGKQIGYGTDGTFIQYDGVNIPWNEIRSYINSNMPTFDKHNKTILIDEYIDYTKTYQDTENDPLFSERWKYIHDASYYENSMGEFSDNNKYINNPINMFEKVGKYSILYQGRDNPVNTNDKFDNYRKWSSTNDGTMDLYVHRKPIAIFKPNIVYSSYNFTLSYQDNSYDPDHQALAAGYYRYDANKKLVSATSGTGKYIGKGGLVDKQWQWKEVDAPTWNDGEFPGGTSSKNYLVRLRVRDMDGTNFQGVWSDYTTLLITRTNMPPVAQFTITPTTLPVNKSIQIVDNSYDPNSHSIVEWRWVLSKTSGTSQGTWNYNYTNTNYLDSKISTDINSRIQSLGTVNAVGNYTLSLQVRDNSSYWGNAISTSTIYQQSFQVVPVNNRPIANFNPTPNPAKIFDTINWGVTYSDPDNNNTGFELSWLLERYKVTKTSDITGNPDNVYSYSGGTPFSGSFESRGLPYGAYRITFSVKDKPPIPPFKISDALTETVTKYMYVLPRINLTSSYEGDATNGKTVTLKATTNEHVTSVRVVFLGQTRWLTLKSQNGNIKHWELDVNIPANNTLLGNQTAAFRAYCDYGGMGTSYYIDSNTLIYVKPILTIIGSYEGDAITGETIKLKAETTKYANTVIVEFLGQTITLTNTSTVGDTKYWEKSFVIPDTIEDSGTYPAKFTAKDLYGQEAIDLVQIYVVALKLMDYRVTNIVNHSDYPYPLTRVSLPVNYKAGYNVTFRINAKGNPINVKAKVYIDGTMDEEISLVKVGTSGSDTIWEGIYYSDPSLPTGTTIRMDLTAYKGSTTYNYNLKEGWNGIVLIVDGTAYEDGRINRTN